MPAAAPRRAPAGAPPRADVPPASRTLARQAAQWRVYLPFYARALALQGSHPTVAASLVDHSSVFDDPLGRLAGTTAYAMRLLYGRDRADTAAELRRLHRGIGGVGFDGRRYHAWDRDVWTWVHLTTAEALLYALDLSCGPLTRSAVEAFYADCRRTGALYGVRPQDMPADVEGLRAYVADGVRTRLRPNPGTERLRELVASADFLGPLPVPGPARSVVARLVAGPTRVVVFGAFPDPVRRQWGVRWTSLDEARYRALAMAGRAMALALPDRLRMVPMAYQALHPV